MIVWSLNPNSDGFIMNSRWKIAMIILQFGFVSIWGTLMDSQKIPWCVMIFPMKNQGFCCLSWFHAIAVLAKVTVYSWFLDIPTWSQKAIAINILSPLGRRRFSWLRLQGFLVSSWLVRAHDSIQQNVLASANLESSRTHRSQGDRHSPN